MNIEEIRERCNRATPGPWEIIEDPKGFLDVVYQEKYRIATVGYRSDAELLSHCREDIPFLLDEIERLEFELSRYRITLRPLDEYHEDYGDVLWYEFPIEEPPYVGSPLSSNWPGYHTHWSPLPDARVLMAALERQERECEDIT